MKKKKAALILLPILLATVIGGWFWNQGHPPAKAEGQLTLYGNIEIREAQLAFNATEHVIEVLVQEGDRVTRGQLLARLDTPLLAAQLAQAEAQREAQRQVVARLEAGSRPEEIDKGRAELEAARAMANAAGDTASRLERLLPKRLASEEDVEAAQTKAVAARAGAKAADRALALLLAGPRKEDLAAARAELKARGAAVALARERLDDANLYAPADGVIRNRILEPGDMAAPQTPALTLAFTDPVWARAYLPEPDLGRVVPGYRALIRTDSYPGKAYEGWVGYISPTAEFTPKTVQTPELRTRLVYSLRVYACNPRDELRLGMPVTVEIPLDQKPPPRRGSEPCGGLP